MVGRVIGERRRFGRLASAALVTMMIASLFVIAPPARAVIGVSVSPTTVAVSEAGTTATYDVVLTEQPTGNVTVTVTDDGQVNVDKATLLFTPSGAGIWSTAQTVTVSAQPDSVVEGAHTGMVTHGIQAGSAAEYLGITPDAVTANITDNDTAGVSVSPTTVAVSEAGTTATYDVVLTSQPTGNVTVTVTDDGQVNVDKATLLFTPSGAGIWSTAQTVTVSAQPDSVVEGAHTGMVTHGIQAGSAAEYLGITPDAVTANITDNDTAGVSVSPTTVAVSEAGTTATYDVVLTSQPTGNVTVTVTDDGQVNVDKATLLFTPSGAGIWSTAQTVTVSAQPDSVVEGAHTGMVTHGIQAGSAAEYLGITPEAVTANITDNDTAGVSVSPTTVAVSEAGTTATYDVVLTSQPTGNVTVTVTGDPNVTVNKATLLFTPSGAGIWSTAQTVTVTAVNDAIVEGGHSGTVSHGIQAGSAPEYVGITPAPVTASITDNDFGVAFQLESSSATEGNTGSTSAIVNLIVDTNGLPAATGPAAPLGATVEVARTGGTAGGTDYAFTSPATVSIGGQADGAVVPVTVTVTGDTVNEVNETVILGLQNALAPPSGTGLISPTANAHTLTILDDDGPPGLSVLDAIPVTEGSGTVRLKFTVVLLPAAPVPITVDYATANGTAIANNDYTALPATPLTFAAMETTKDVYVTVRNDTIDEIDETVFLNLTNSPVAAIADAQAVGTIKDDDNQAPKIDSFLITDAAGNPRTTFSLGETTKVNVQFSDPGVADTHEVRVSWEDGTPDFYQVMPGAGVAVRNATATHAYQIAAQHTITVIITDEEGAFVRQDAIPIIVDGSSHLDTVGLVDPATGVWRMRNAIGTVSTFYYGNPGDYPFVGDWDCNGSETPGLYRQSDGYVYLRNSNTQGNADIRFFFGNPGDIPLAGDFNGNGCDTVSIYRPSEGRVFIINALGANDGGLGAAEFDYYFGNPGDKPFVGDFNRNGIETVGLHRETTGLVYFRNSHTQGNADNQFYFGDPGDRLVAGDWTRDGTDTPALFRPSNTTMYFRHSNTQGNADDQFVWGQSPWLPVAGYFGL